MPSFFGFSSKRVEKEIKKEEIKSSQLHDIVARSVKEFKNIQLLIQEAKQIFGKRTQNELYPLIITDHTKKNPLHLAADIGQVEFLRLFLDELAIHVVKEVDEVASVFNSSDKHHKTVLEYVLISYTKEQDEERRKTILSQAEEMIGKGAKINFNYTGIEALNLIQNFKSTTSPLNKKEASAANSGVQNHNDKKDEIPLTDMEVMDDIESFLDTLMIKKESELLLDVVTKLIESQLLDIKSIIGEKKIPHDIEEIYKEKLIEKTPQLHRDIKNNASIAFIKNTISQNPNALKLLDPEGRNILHTVIMKYGSELIFFIIDILNTNEDLSKDKENILNHKDVDELTPLCYLLSYLAGDITKPSNESKNLSLNGVKTIEDARNITEACEFMQQGARISQNHSGIQILEKVYLAGKIELVTKVWEVQKQELQPIAAEINRHLDKKFSENIIREFSELHKCVQYKKYSEAVKMLDNDNVYKLLSSCDYKKRTPLHLAVISDQLNFLELFIESLKKLEDKKLVLSVLNKKDTQERTVLTWLLLVDLGELNKHNKFVKDKQIKSVKSLVDSGAGLSEDLENTAKVFFVANDTGLSGSVALIKTKLPFFTLESKHSHSNLGEKTEEHQEPDGNLDFNNDFARVFQ